VAAVVKEPEVPDGAQKPERARTVKAGPCKGCAERAARVDELTLELGAAGEAITGLETRVFLWVGIVAGIGIAAAAIALVALARTLGGE
jgi:hypothetical protein